MKLLILACTLAAAAVDDVYTDSGFSGGSGYSSGGSGFFPGGSGFSSGGSGFFPGGSGFSSGGSGFSSGGSGFSSGGSGFSSGGSGFPSGGSGFFSGGSGFSSGGSGFSSGGSGFSSGGFGFSGGSCGPGQVRHVDGSCVTPQVTRNLYVFSAPPTSPIVGPRPNVPPPRVEHNVLFIRTPEGLVGQHPVVVPPPQQRNIVYVLNKRPEVDQQVIHVPEPEQQTPEVFFVNYAEGDNPTLPTGEDLQSALSAASQGGGNIISSGTGSFDDSHEISSFNVGGIGISTPSTLYHTR